MKNTPEGLRTFVVSATDAELQFLLDNEEKAAEYRKPKLLKVTEEEQGKIKEILSTFQSYIDGHYFFDIFYSSKYGYYRLDIDGEHDQFSTADGIMGCLINEFSNDVRALQIGGQHMTTGMRPAEEVELRKRITPYIEKLSSSGHYLELLNAFIARHSDEP